MIQLLVILCALLAFAFTFVWFLAKKGLGFFWPVSNVEAIVLRGEIFDHSICGDIDNRFEEKVEGEVRKVIKTPKKTTSLLYKQFGIRYFGWPGIYKIGTVIVNYPPQLKSTSGLQHIPNDPAPGFSIRHNYLITLTSVEFQGGVAFDLEFNVDIKLERADCAWDRNEKFLDPLGQAIEGAVKELALTINATDFVGKTELFKKNEALDGDKKTIGDKKTTGDIKKRADQYRTDMCVACMELNKNTNRGIVATAKPVPLSDKDSVATENPKESDKDEKVPAELVPLSEICGYSIVEIRFKDLCPSDQNSKDRLNQLEKLGEEAIKTAIANQQKETALAESEGAALRIKAPGLAQAKVDLVSGLVKVRVARAAGMADVDVLEAKKTKIGERLIVAEFNANALEKTGVKIINIGGNSGGSNLLMSLPGTILGLDGGDNTKATETETKPKADTAVEPPKK